MNRRNFVSLAGLVTAFFASARFAEAKAFFEKPRQRHVCPSCGAERCTIEISSNNELLADVTGQIGVSEGIPTASMHCENGCFLYVKGKREVRMLVARSRMRAAVDQALPGWSVTVVDDNWDGVGVQVRRPLGKDFMMVMSIEQSLAYGPGELAHHIRTSAQRAGWSQC